MVGQALRGAALVPLDKLEVNNIHSFGGCVVLEDASRRYALPELLAPLSQRNASLVHALIFGGLLFPPSIAPFQVESRSVRLAMFCGLDPDKERFDLTDLIGALRELDERWPAGQRAADPAASRGCACDHAVPDIAVRSTGGNGRAGNGCGWNPGATGAGRGGGRGPARFSATDGAAIEIGAAAADAGRGRRRRE